MYQKISDNPIIQSHYEQCRRSGTPHNLAEMFAFRQAPQSNTDREFMAGYENGRQFQNTPQAGEWYKSRAEAAGVSVTGKAYFKQLANYPGDPRAWISSRDEAKKLLEERGWGCDGMVKVKMAEKEFEPGPLVDPELVEEHAINACLNDPALEERAGKPGGFAEIKQEVFEKIKPDW